MLIIPALLLCIGVALFRRSENNVVEGRKPDVPLRLLRWAAGLLSEQRHEWGQAMLGELDHIEGRARRWRFAIGCVVAALLLPPWGRAGAAVLAMLAVAIGGVGVYAFVLTHYGLGGGSWLGVGIVSVLLLGFTLAAVPLLRRPGVAVPGLLGGVFVALTWIAISGFGFMNFVIRVWPAWTVPLLFFVLPAAVGVMGTLWRGNAAAGRRIARLAAISAGLAVYLYGTIAVAHVGAGGPPDDSGFTVGYIIDDRLGNNMIFYLLLFPLVTATFGWAASAALAHMRPQLVAADLVSFESYGVASPSPVVVGSGVSVTAAPRTRHVVLQYGLVATAALLVGATLLVG